MQESASASRESLREFREERAERVEAHWAQAWGWLEDSFFMRILLESFSYWSERRSLSWRWATDEGSVRTSLERRDSQPMQIRV